MGSLLDRIKDAAPKDLKPYVPPADDMKGAHIYILSHERYELLRCCLASVCASPMTCYIHVIDDSSQDPRVMKLICAYLEAGLIKSVTTTPHHLKHGWSRRLMMNHFDVDDAHTLMQLDGDIVVPPGGCERMISIFRQLHQKADVQWLGACHMEYFYGKPKNTQEVISGDERYLIERLTRNASEAAFVMSKEAVRYKPALDTVGPPRTHLGNFIVKVAEMGVTATLITPPIRFQHMGAFDSIVWPGRPWPRYLFRGLDGKPWQPFEWCEIDYKEMESRYPKSVKELSDRIIEHAEVELPSV